MKAIFSKSFILIATLFHLVLLQACSKEDPNKKRIVEYMQKQLKAVPIIEDFKLDSTAYMESYSAYWKGRIDEVKGWELRDYQKQYNDSKAKYEECKKFGLSSTASYKEEMEKAKIKLDNAKNGIFDESKELFATFENLSKEKSKSQLFSVKYKLSESGPVLIQKFIIEELPKDTSVYATDKSLFHFIEMAGIRR